MPDPLVAHDDLELFLTDWFRTALAERPEPVCHGVTVDRVERGAEKALIVRDDGTTDTDVLTGAASIGLTVLAGTTTDPDDAKELARIVRALVSQIPSPDPANPVAAVTGQTGPFLVEEESPVARVYQTATLAVVARLL